MREPQTKAIHLKDYAAPAFRVETVELDVDIREADALVKARLDIVRAGAGALVLDGDELELVSVSVDGAPARHDVTAEALTVHDVPDRFTLETVTRIVPQQNT
ncbi:MAG TPA: aminopeptidase N, partial [Burkholderiales bacterium]